MSAGGGTHHPKSVDWRSDVASPKSAIQIFSPLRLQRMFSGLRSRWKMPREWQYSTASTICRKILRINASLPMYYCEVSFKFICGRRNESVSRTYSLLLGDHSEQVSLVAKVHDDKDVVSLLDHLVHTDDIGVPACELVQGDLAPLKVPLASIDTRA